MENEKGYVIRCHNLLEGTTYFRGMKGIIRKTKDGFAEGDTFTFAGAKRALSNLRRLSLDGDMHQYSIERPEEYYLLPVKPKKRDLQFLRESIDHAFKRLDELWDGNNFDNGDKMRINEVRAVLRTLKEDLGKGQRKQR